MNKKTWIVSCMRMESCYDEYIWEAKLSRVCGNKEDVKKHICQTAEEKGFECKPGDVEESKRGLCLELEGLETTDERLLIMAEPEKPPVDISKEKGVRT